MALAPVPSTEARPTFLRGFLHPLGGDGRDLDADEGEQRHAGGDPDGAVQAAARGVERRRSWPLETKNQPTTPTNSSGRNFSTTVTFWNQAICRTPARFTVAGTHSPSSAIPQFVMADGWLMPNSAST